MTRARELAELAAGYDSGGGFGFRNRIINPAMVIDQRNAGASVTIPLNAITYVLDRWFGYANQASKFSIQRNAGAVTPPSGFTNYLGVTSLAATTPLATEEFVVSQRIEGFNVSDLAWGTASAQTVTLSFFVRSSLTGTFGGNVSNSAGNRSYVFSYTISAANTWEQKTLTIPGDTSGTWATDNTSGIRLGFDMGCGSNYKGTAGVWSGSNLDGVTGGVNVIGTNGATFYITGVQLEKGSTATSFDYRPYTTELQLCQRYFETYALQSSSLIGNSTAATSATAVLSWCVTKRASPTITLPSAGQSTGTVTFLTSNGGYPAVTGTNAVEATNVDKTTIVGNGYSGLTSSNASIFWSTGASTIQISAEL